MGLTSIIIISSYKARMYRFNYDNNVPENSIQYVTSDCYESADTTISHVDLDLFFYLKIEVNLLLCI